MSARDGGIGHRRSFWNSEGHLGDGKVRYHRKRSPLKPSYGRHYVHELARMAPSDRRLPYCRRRRRINEITGSGRTFGGVASDVDTQLFPAGMNGIVSHRWQRLEVTHSRAVSSRHAGRDRAFLELVTHSRSSAEQQYRRFSTAEPNGKIDAQEGKSKKVSGYCGSLPSPARIRQMAFFAVGG